MTNIFKALLLAALLFTGGTATRADDSSTETTVDGVTYTLATAEDGTQYATAKYGGSDSDKTSLTTVTILSTVTINDQEVQVTEIAASGFANCTALQEVTLPEGLTTIGDYAFSADAKLTQITLPTTTQTIGNGAFRATGLTEVAIPKSVSTISQYCFAYCSSLSKISFEGGGGLAEISMNCFESCTSLTEVTVPEGVTQIRGGAFMNCSSLKSVTLPKSIAEIQWMAFSQCTALKTVKLYAVARPTTYPNDQGGSFYNMPTTAQLLVPKTSTYESWSEYFQGDGTEGSSGVQSLFNMSDDGTINVTDSEGFTDVFHALADPDYDLTDANVILMSDIVYNPIEIDADALSASNIYTTIDAFPTVGSYSGNLKGATVSNFAARSAGLFDTIGEGAVIDGLYFEDALIYVDPTDPSYEAQGDDVTVHFLAKTNNGTVSNFGFSGDFIVDEDLAAGKEISVCAVNNMGDDAVINGFFRIGSLIGVGDGNTKRCITIKQNLGVKRPPGKSTKLATNKSLASNKSATDGFYTYSDEELTKSIREFSDEEFASGAVAYWLNYSGPGYTGDYTGYWAQGKKVPVPATSVDGVSNALGLVNYGTTDMTHVTSAPQFANNGSEITIEYDQTPTSVTIGGKAYTGFGTSGMTLTFDAAKAISIAFNKSEPAAIEQPAAPEKVSYSVSGRTVTISGAPANAEIKLTSFTGRMVAAVKG